MSDKPPKSNIALKNWDKLGDGEHDRTIKEAIERMLAPGVPKALVMFADYGEGEDRVRVHAVGGISTLIALAISGMKGLQDMIRNARSAQTERGDSKLN